MLLAAAVSVAVIAGTCVICGLRTDLPQSPLVSSHRSPSSLSLLEDYFAGATDAPQWLWA
ncbi:hypothetical protein PRIPAC_97089 [Pristionchus pacificus]|uniref:Uncharacterized protein n=1 Tax=Pristionchus pacificus TaxID=54126 RepID=A0A2A6B2R9_PRIPA|nr:hypothetical protein PRIPAC_97089 [Pristionchus pacificus]|eukprot:PDM60169.1 hypothetical protein PRIPAC_53994 [Pristionchus pacificus]